MTKIVDLDPKTGKIIKISEGPGPQHPAQAAAKEAAKPPVTSRKPSRKPHTPFPRNNVPVGARLVKAALKRGLDGALSEAQKMLIERIALQEERIQRRRNRT